MNIDRLFYGEYTATLDKKFRLCVPSEIRQKMENGFVYLALEHEKYVIFPGSRLESCAERCLSYGLEERELFFSSVKQLEIDAQGRVILPRQAVSKLVSNDNRKISLKGAGDVIVLEKIVDEDKG